MKSASRKLQISAPKEKVWAVIADLGGVYQFHSGVTSSHYTSDEKSGVGASRVCELPPDPNNPNSVKAVAENATEWNEGESFTLDVKPKGEGDWSYKDFTGRLSLKEEGDGTMVTISANWELSDDAKVDDAAAQAQIEMLERMVLIGLKQFVETGKALTPEDKMKIGQDIAEGKAPTCAI